MQLYARRISSWSLVRNQFFSKISIYYQRSPLPCWWRRGTDGAGYSSYWCPAHLPSPASVYTWLHLARQWVVAAPRGRMSSLSSLSQPQPSPAYLLSISIVSVDMVEWSVECVLELGWSFWRAACLVFLVSRMCVIVNRIVTSVLHFRWTSVLYLKHKQVQFFIHVAILTKTDR